MILRGSLLQGEKEVTTDLFRLLKLTDTSTFIFTASLFDSFCISIIDLTLISLKEGLK